MIIGLTGGIGSGKSTVAGFFRELGIPVYDSDKEAKDLMEESSEVKGAIIKLFGSEAYYDKRLNKTFISNIVFKDRKKLKELNAIVHPAVRKHFLAWSSEQNSPYVIQETALIFENQAQDKYDAVILVTTTELSRIQRVVDRDGVSEAQVKSRMANQLPDKGKKIHADFIIENVDVNDTKNQVNEIHKTLLGQIQSSLKL